MKEEIEAYEKYLLNFGVVERPVFPKFDVLAYTDNEYVYVVEELMNDFNNIDDDYLVLQHLLGE